MLAEQWKRLRAAYDAVMDAPESEQQRLIDEFSGSDPELGRQLIRLLTADPHGAAFLEVPLMRLGPPQLEPGVVLSNRFTLLRLLGQGGMGEVWAARDQSLGADVAVKMVREVDQARADLRRFTNEIQMARRISHPNVCRVYEFFEDAAATPPRAYLTMELLEGETLAARLARSGALPPAEALTVFRQIARGLEAAHDAGVIHRDLKPANIMLLAGSSSRHAVVMDFGLARDRVRLESQGATTPGTLIGTPEYMAPEQVSGSGVSPATDIYALGLILFEMLRGVRPFASSSTLDSWMRRAREGPEKLSGAIPGVHARIDGLIRRCLEYEAGRRPQSVRELLDTLDSAFYVPVPKSRRFWAVAASVVLLAAAAAGLYAYNRTRAALPSIDALEWYEDAQQALAEGASVRALKAIERAIELAPAFAPSYAALAEIRLELDMPSAAQDAMLRANAVARDRRGLPEAYVAYMDGIQALLQHQCGEAMAQMRRGVDLVDATARPFRMATAARAMERCYRPKEAQALMADAARLDPRNAAIPLRAARIAARDRNFDTALALLDTAEPLFRDRNNLEALAEVMSTRASVLSSQDRLDDADALLTRAAEMARALSDERQQIRVLLQQAIVQRKRGDTDAAGALTASALELGRRSNLEALTLEGLFAAGNVHLVRNQFVEARALFDRVASIAETYRHEEYAARARLGIGTLLVRVNENDKAIDEIRSARGFYERVGDAINVALADTLLGQVLSSQGRFQEAIDHLARQLSRARAAKDVEQTVAAQEALAWAWAGAGHYREAIEAYDEAVEVYRGSERARNLRFSLLNKADVLGRVGRFAEAEAALAEASRIPVDAPEIGWRTDLAVASIAIGRGQYATALAAVRRSMARGADPSIWRARSTVVAACLAAVRSAALRDRDEFCARAVEEAAEPGELPLRQSALLAGAEWKLSVGDREGAARLLRQVGASLSGPSQHRWWYLALSVRAGDDPRAEAELTRELDAFRLSLGQDDYRTWRERADVARLLPARLTNDA